MAWSSGTKWCDMRLFGIAVIGLLVVGSVFVTAQKSTKEEEDYPGTEEVDPTNFVIRVSNFFWQSGRLGYKHVWPELEIGWRIVVGTIIGFLGASFGTVGGVGGGGIFVPMLTLIIGFDEKSSTALSKCMIMGGAGATVFYNLRLRHPTLELPVIDYDLALLFQPMLMLGISIGVAFNVVFADWMITALLIFIFLITATRALLKGIETWKKETITKKEAAARRLQSNNSANEDVEYNPIPRGPNSGTSTETKESKRTKVSVLENVYWKELGLLVAVWVLILALQIAKNNIRTCSVLYWVLNFLQIPVTGGVTLYEAINIYTGRRVIASRGETGKTLRVYKLFLYCMCGIIAGILGGLLGLGGGFILGPLFLEMGIPPQVSSATATFAMTFSSSMSVVEYYLLKRFPVPYALYFIVVATISAIIGQYAVNKVIKIIGRASIIIFILSITIYVSAVSLGGVGIAKVVEKIKHKEYMGFENICKYK